MPSEDSSQYLSGQSDAAKSSTSAPVAAIVLGMTLVSFPIILGRSHFFVAYFLIVSIFMTLLWRKAYQPWSYLTSISAAVPIPISRYNVACNLIFGLWYIILHPKDLISLPKWMYVPPILLVLGIITSSINWISIDPARSVMRQVTFGYNLFIGPFLLLPAVYLKMQEIHDPTANLRGLLFCLIVPSSLILIAAKMFGTIVNEWEASRHVQMLAQGFYLYRLGGVSVNFLRTEVGFILAALICSSSAVAFSPVEGKCRLIAGVCLLSNLFLLLMTGSFGSIVSCLCGLAVIFFNQLRSIGSAKVVISLVLIALLMVISYSLSPPSTKEYLEKRFEHRVTDADTDRVFLWMRAMENLAKNPQGVGWTMSVGDVVKSFIHNDYLTYAVSYGVIGGLAYPFLVAGLLISFSLTPKTSLEDPSVLAVYLCGLGVLVAVAVNGITDHSNENRWYFNVIWSLVWYGYFGSKAKTETIDREEASLSGNAQSWNWNPGSSWLKNDSQSPTKQPPAPAGHGG